MGKKALIIINIILIIGINILLFRAEETPIKSFVIRSNDYTANMELSSFALPEGVKMTDIKITRVTGKNHPITNLKEDTWAIYKLEPEGIKFSTPVFFETRLKNINGNVPVALQVSENKIEYPTSLEVKMLFDSDIAIVRVPVSHFSHMYVTNYDDDIYFRSSSSASDSHEGEPVKVQDRINIVNDEASLRTYIIVGNLWQSYIKKETATIMGTHFPGIYGKTTPPKRTVDRPPSRTPITGGQYTIPVIDYYCADTGAEAFQNRYFVHALTREIIRNPEGEIIEERHDGGHGVILDIRSPDFECLERENKEEGGMTKITPPSVFMDVN